MCSPCGASRRRRYCMYRLVVYDTRHPADSASILSRSAGDGPGSRERQRSESPWTAVTGHRFGFPYALRCPVIVLDVSCVSETHGMRHGTAALERPESKAATRWRMPKKAVTGASARTWSRSRLLMPISRRGWDGAACRWCGVSIAWRKDGAAICVGNPWKVQRFRKARLFNPPTSCKNTDWKGTGRGRAGRDTKLRLSETAATA